MMKSVISRYRVMAIVSGVMSLLLWFIYMPVKYLMDNPDLHDATIWIPMVHGYLYPIYVLFAIQFSVQHRWSISKIIGLILAGTLPVASIATERHIVKKYKN